MLVLKKERCAQDATLVFVYDCYRPLYAIVKDLCIHLLRPTRRKNNLLALNDNNNSFVVSPPFIFFGRSWLLPH